MTKIVRTMLARSLKYFTARFAEPVNFRQEQLFVLKKGIMYV